MDSAPSAPPVVLCRFNSQHEFDEKAQLQRRRIPRRVSRRRIHWCCGQWSVVGIHEPLAIDHRQPPTTNHQPPTTNHRPLTTARDTLTSSNLILEIMLPSFTGPPNIATCDMSRSRLVTGCHLDLAGNRFKYLYIKKFPRKGVQILRGPPIAKRGSTFFS